MVNSGVMRADDDLLTARAVVLVEGVSDQIAVETLAGRRGRDLAAEGIAVLPVGGAHGVGRYLARGASSVTPAC